MTKRKAHTSAGFGWLLKMAWRDGKASGKRLLLFMASIIIGIAAVVAIESFSVNLRDNIALQSKSLMGADFIIDSDKKVNEEVQTIMDSLGGANAREISFSSMAAFPGTPHTKLVQVRGVEKGFPFYGELETLPAGASEEFQAANGALVDATLLVQFDLKEGDSIKIGNVSLPIAGALQSVPGSSSLFSSIAPPVLIPFEFIAETGLIQTGSRIRYKYYFVAPEMDMDLLDRELDPVLDAADADLDTHTSTSRRLGRRYENFGKFLNLVAFVALLLGCIGIASAINIYLKEKLKAVAILKCMGATRRQTFQIYLLQIAGIGLLGGIMGTVTGLLLQRLFPWLLSDLLPIDISLSYSPSIIFTGIILGVIMSVLFALYPLIGTFYVSPLQALRVENKAPQRSRLVAVLVSLAVFSFIFLFSFWLLENALYSLAFVAGLLVTFSILAALAHLFMRLIRKYFPKTWGFTARQSLLNLYRPQNQTLILVLAIGVGSFLISTLYFTKDMLLEQASLEAEADNPNMILLDVQNEQQKKVAETIVENNLEVIDDIPIVTMRVNSIKGRPVNDLRKDSTSGINGWILQHEFRVTYRDSMINSESLEGGEWIPEFAREGPVPISVSADFAEDAVVKVGDPLVFNVQGVLLPTRVASIRQVDWARMQMNFSIVFPKGVLEEAPQFRVLTTKIPDDSVSAALQRDIVKDFPNVSMIDLRKVLKVIEDILGKIAWLINFMAFFSILTGIIVLLGAVRTSKYQRLRENVLLRTMGARNFQILKITALEYFYLGALGSLAGILLSLVSSLLLAWLLFDSSFIPSKMPFLILFPGVTLLVLLIGLGNSLGVIKSPPLEVLRKESR